MGSRTRKTVLDVHCGSGHSATVLTPLKRGWNSYTHHAQPSVCVLSRLAHEPLFLQAMAVQPNPCNRSEPPQDSSNGDRYRTFQQPSLHSSVIPANRNSRTRLCGIRAATDQTTRMHTKNYTGGKRDTERDSTWRHRTRRVPPIQWSNTTPPMPHTAALRVNTNTCSSSNLHLKRPSKIINVTRFVILFHFFSDTHQGCRYIGNIYRARQAGEESAA